MLSVRIVSVSQHVKFTVRKSFSLMFLSKILPSTYRKMCNFKLYSPSLAYKNNLYTVHEEKTKTKLFN